MRHVYLGTTQIPNSKFPTFTKTAAAKPFGEHLEAA